MVASLPSAGLAGEARPCADADTWKQMNELRESTRGKAIESSIEYLYQYRVFLCGQVGAGRLTETEANPLFEAKRMRLMKKLRQNVTPS